MAMSRTIVLASASPRRTELLSEAGVEHVVVAADVAEAELMKQVKKDENYPKNLVIYLARQKALAVVREVADDAVIIAADTVVAVNGEILGKPNSKTEARDMLWKLSGSRHSVFTGYAILNKKNKLLLSGVEETIIYFRELSDDDIEGYINTDEPYDKAGGYAIQEHGDAFVEKIEGDYNNVVGLPVDKVLEILKILGRYTQ